MEGLTDFFEKAAAAVAFCMALGTSIAIFRLLGELECVTAGRVYNFILAAP